MLKVKCPIHGEAGYVDTVAVEDVSGTLVFGDLLDCDCIVVQVEPGVPPVCL